MLHAARIALIHTLQALLADESALGSAIQVMLTGNRGFATY
jgi:hypothetical protein